MTAPPATVARARPASASPLHRKRAVPPPPVPEDDEVLEDLDAPPEVSCEALDMAAYLGMSLPADNPLLWIAQDALEAELPAGWTELTDQDGQPYFADHLGHTTRSHPHDAYYKALYDVLKSVSSASTSATPTASPSTSSDRRLRDIGWESLSPRARARLGPLFEKAIPSTLVARRVAARMVQLPDDGTTGSGAPRASPSILAALERENVLLRQRVTALAGEYERLLAGRETGTEAGLGRGSGPTTSPGGGGGRGAPPTPTPTGAGPGPGESAAAAAAAPTSTTTPAGGSRNTSSITAPAAGAVPAHPQTTLVPATPSTSAVDSAAEKKRLQEELKEQQEGHERVKTALTRVRRDATTTRQTTQHLRADLTHITTALQSLRVSYAKECSALKTQLARATASLFTQFDASRKEASDWEVLHADRRRLFGELMKLKGNIRVFVRVRPMSTKELKDAAAAAADYQHHPLAVTLPPSDASQRTVEVHTTQPRVSRQIFEFDRCFGPATGQATLFEDVRSLVEAACDGFNVTVLAYGQTGSGKTHTMEGTPTDPGVTIRAFQLLGQLGQERGLTFATTVFEVYNDAIRDLLSTKEDKARWDAKELSYDVKVDEYGATYVTNMRRVPCVSEDDFVRTVRQGQKARAVTATSMNEHSSRSHLVVTIEVTNRMKKTSKLVLVDLAGSERISKSEAKGDALKEAISINKSLTALGDVIATLAERDKVGDRRKEKATTTTTTTSSSTPTSSPLGSGPSPSPGNSSSVTVMDHVPFRNSKLTHVLQDSLGGGSKTLFIVACSPAASNAQETTCSLQFAARAAAVNLSTNTGTERVMADRLRGLTERAQRENAERQRKLQEQLARAEKRAEEAENQLKQQRQQVGAPGSSSLHGTPDLSTSSATPTTPTTPPSTIPTAWGGTPGPT